MSSASSPMISVIIPYFQRKSGLLSHCVQSILTQSGNLRIEVLVVDDESPISAQSELSALTCDRENIRIIRRPNGGPGAARNTALDNLDPATTYVALLDSDDSWEEGFLDTALTALDSGYDLFFANTKRYSQGGTRFDWSEQPGLNLDPTVHRQLDVEGTLYEYVGDFFDFLVRRSNILSSSAMVYRRAVAPFLRFREEFYNGQDRVFKLELGVRVGKVAFSPTVLCVEGEGINIFDSANWGSPRSISLLSSYIEMSKFILREVPLNLEQTRFVQRQLGRSRHSFAANLLHLMVNRDKINMQVVKKTFRSDPMTMLLLGPNVAKAIMNKLSSRQTTR